MRIERIELRVVRLPLVRFFETSFGRIDDRTFVVVQVDEDGASGFGECVAGASPWYSPETTSTAWHIISDFIAPIVLARELGHPRDVFDALGAIRGHHMAKAAVEMAVWDLFARQQDLPLSAVLGGRRASVESGASIGIQPTIEQLLDRVEAERAAGYRRIKIKIKPGWDHAPVERIRGRFGDVPLMVDANAAYRAADASHLRTLDAFDLLMIEQPLDYDDLRDHAVLQGQLRTPICLDESIPSMRAAEEAIETAACRIINIKPGRMGGHQPSVRLHDLAARHGLPVWHGGMLESGIGRAHNLHLSSLPNFTMPGDVAASGRYFAPDLIDPPIELEPDGTILVPTGAGIGVTIVQERLEAATRKTAELRAR